MKWTPGRLHVERRRLLSERDKQREAAQEQVKSVIRSPKTSKKTLSDFPEVAKFFDEQFPELDLSDVSIYLTEPSVMNKCGFVEAGGLFCASMNCILLRRQISIEGGSKSRFDRVLDKAIRAVVDPEDVLVHEMLHAVSAKVRHGRQFIFGEEEFVYTNSTEFYIKRKGMSDDDIVDKNLLPFCLNDIMRDRKRLQEMFAEVRRTEAGFPSPDAIFKLRGEEWRRFMDKYAEIFVPRLVKMSQTMGHEMIRLYRQYGASLLHCNVAPQQNSGTSMRFRNLDMDDDW